MARKADDATILLRMTPQERDEINRALGRGKVNITAVELLLAYARNVGRSQPRLDQEAAA